MELLCRRLSPDAQLFLVGFSMGANTLVKYLGEAGLSGGNLPKNVAGAVSLCNPMRIGRLQSPWSQILTFGAKKQMIRHRNSVDQMKCINYQQAMKKALLHSPSMEDISSHTIPHMIRSSNQYPFDNSIGYQSNTEYWNDASSQNYVSHVPVPLLVCFASDDKIAQSTIAAMNSCLSNPNVILVKTSCGGHIGWHCSNRLNPFGSWNFKSSHDADKSWADRVTVNFVDAVIRGNHHAMASESRKEVARHTIELTKQLQSRL